MLPKRSFFKYDGHGPVLFVCLAYLVLQISVQNVGVWVHLELLVSGNSIFFYSEDIKPKALTTREGWPLSRRGMAAMIWNLEWMHHPVVLALMVAAIRVPAFVLTDKAEVPTLLLLCRHCKPGVTCEVVPKMKAQMHNWPGCEWYCLVDWVGRGPPILCYATPKP